MQKLIHNNSREFLKQLYNQGLLDPDTYISIMDCKNKKQLLKTLQTPELVRPEYEDAIFRLIRNNRDKSNPEDTLLTPREMNFMIELVRNCGVMLRKNAQKLLKTEYMLREMERNLIDMQLIHRLELNNFDILYVINFEFMQEAGVRNCQK